MAVGYGNTALHDMCIASILKEKALMHMYSYSHVNV